MMQLYDQPAAMRGLDGMPRQLESADAEQALRGLSRIVDTVRDAAGDRFRVDFDATLVRGMGYYTGPIFEIASSDFTGGSIAGGGRYDGMIGGLLGREVPATGFSIGFERVVDILGKRPDRIARAERRVALLFDETDPEPRRMVEAAQGLRARGLLVALERRTRNAGAQRAALEKQGYDGVATVGVEGRPDVQWFAERTPPGEARGRE
jgi:histidyl-tRNA synthetase